MNKFKISDTNIMNGTPHLFCVEASSYIASAHGVVTFYDDRNRIISVYHLSPGQIITRTSPESKIAYRMSI